MRSYQGIVLSLGLSILIPYPNALSQEESSEPESAPAPPPPPNANTTPAQVPQPPQSATPLTPAPSPGTKAGPLKASGAKVPNKTKTRKKAKKKILTDSLQNKRGTSELDAAIVGEAQTLPKNVFRARYILKTVEGNKGYDSAGKKQDLGASLSAVGHALSFEYGFTDRITLQIIAPYTSSNELVINADKFKRSKVYEDQYSKFLDEVIPSLIQRGLCTNAVTCRTAIDNGLALATATPVELPSGETATVGANVPIRDAINSIILKSVEPIGGKAGLGDVQVGLGYNVYNSPRNVLTIGLGMRFPSGLFSNVANAYRAPGAGFMTGGLILRYDLRLTPVVFSFSHQAEYSLNKAKRTRSSLLSPNFLNGDDPTNDDPTVVGAGDGIPNEMMIERKGIYHEGFARLSYALGHMTHYLKPFAVYGYYNFSVDPEYHNLGHLYKKKQELYSASYAFSADGLALSPMIPASFTYRRDIAIGGRNAFLAPDSHLFYFTGYYKF
ncbi:MAG: hypothetical protein EOP10_14125 [Proteobacteria bacterium]|nr:MAG: hypothetical protein EOP10_14125 [Pseudomonadota bacterium]